VQELEHLFAFVVQVNVVGCDDVVLEQLEQIALVLQQFLQAEIVNELEIKLEQ
jgi:hypothetical protein